MKQYETHKYSQNESKSKYKWITGVIVICLVCVIGAFIGVFAKNAPIQSEQKSNQSVSLETPYGLISFPEEWQQYLVVEEQQDEAYRVCYKAQISKKKVVPLFDIVFGGNEVNPLGYFFTADGNKIQVSVVLYNLEFDKNWTEEEMQIVSAMQEEVNYVIGQLSIQDGSLIGIEDESAEDIEIQTPYCKVYYPGIWKNYIRIQENNSDIYSLTIYAVLDEEEVAIAELLFGEAGNDGVWKMQLEDGELMDVGITLFEADSDGGWTDFETEIVSGIQEDLNYMLGKLPIVDVVPDTDLDDELGEEVISTILEGAYEEETEEQSVKNEADGESVSIQTPYATLYYPACWAEYLQTEYFETDDYTVAFYGKVDGHDRQHLFSLTFGEQESTPVGVVVADNGNEINVYVSLNAFTPDDSWEDKDSDIIIAMQEDVNYVLAELLE